MAPKVATAAVLTFSTGTFFICFLSVSQIFTEIDEARKMLDIEIISLKERNDDLWREMVKLGVGSPETRQKRQYGGYESYGGYGSGSQGIYPADGPREQPIQDHGNLNKLPGKKNSEELIGTEGGASEEKLRGSIAPGGPQSSPEFSRQEAPQTPRGKNPSCSCNIQNNCSPGPRGPPGSKGENGLPGIPGVPGLDGEDAEDINDIPFTGCHRCPPGPSGPEGPPGRPGIRGMRGASGQPGPPGRDGQPGCPGEMGLPGSAGEPGTPGAPGEKGEDGEKPVSSKGIRGPPGQVGPPGIGGAPGKNATRGPPGTTGEAGTQGAAGAPGKPGEQGAPGLGGRPGGDAEYCPCPSRTQRSAGNGDRKQQLKRQDGFIR